MFISQIIYEINVHFDLFRHSSLPGITVTSCSVISSQSSFCSSAAILARYYPDGLGGMLK